MVNLAKVYIWGKYVGAVMWDERRQTALFEYDDDFKSTGLQLAPLTMPLGDGIFSFGNLNKDTYLGLPGLLADALPDAYGKALLDRWLAMNGRTFANPVERLCYQGKRSMGALEFVPAQDAHLEQNSRLEIDSLVEIAREVMDNKSQLDVNLNGSKKEAIANIIKVGTSAGGQRAKAVIAYNENTGEVRSGQIDAPEGFGHWLLKLDGVTNAALGDPKGEWTSQHQMSINNKWTDFTIDDFRAVAQNIHIKKCDSIIEQVCDAVSQWKSIAKECEIPNGITNTIENHLLYDVF